jgi:hypothetical protein
MNNDIPATLKKDIIYLPLMHLSAMPAGRVKPYQSILLSEVCNLAFFKL